MKTYRLKITLAGIEPAIWRRIELDGESTLGELHDIVQRVMGWQDCHLHSFEIGGKSYGMVHEESDDNMLDEDDFFVCDVLTKKGARCEYVYDFGDGWTHEIVVEAIGKTTMPVFEPVCTGGARACPLEDSGGPDGYLDKLAAVKDPGHPDHAEISEWVPEDFDPEAFDVDDANAALLEMLEEERQLLEEMVSKGMLPGQDDVNEPGATMDEMLEENPMLEEMLQRFIAKLRVTWGVKSDEEAIERVNAMTAQELTTLQTELVQNDPIEMAQTLALTALSEDDMDEAIPIAEQALSLDPQNIDARLLLILCKEKPDIELLVAVRSLAAEAERSVDADDFRKYAGSLSRSVFARPYLRAMSALISMLSKTGHIDEAISSAEKLLVLDQADLSNVRARLAVLLLTSRQLARAAEVLNECEEDNEVALWSKVLERHLSNDLKGAEKALRVARKASPHVAKYLLTNATFEELADEMSDEEYIAWVSADMLSSAWRGSPKSIQWLREKTR